MLQAEGAQGTGPEGRATETVTGTGSVMGWAEGDAVQLGFTGKPGARE